MRRQDALSCKPTPMWRKALAWITSLAMALMFAPAVAPASAWADDGSSGKVPVTYLDADGNERTCTDYVEVTSSSSGNPVFWNDSSTWYVASGDIEIPNRVVISNDVNLILADSCHLSIKGNVCVKANKSFTIYAQSTDPTNMGSFSATAENSSGRAGIGSNNTDETTGTIAIHGGRITAQGSAGAAGIGAGANRSCSDITITNGIITARTTDSSYAGIGGGKDSTATAGDVSISGGVIIAKTRSDKSSKIGSGANSICKSVDISSNAIVYTSSISADSVSKNSCIVFEGGNGKIYGDSVTPLQSFTIDSGKTLTIDGGQTLTIPNGVTLINNGTITNNGTIRIMQGNSLSGTVNGTNRSYTYITTGEGFDSSSYAKWTYGPISETLTPADGYYFPDLFPPLTSGQDVTVTRNSYTQITISGTPTSNTTVALPDAMAKTKPSAPSGITAKSSTGTAADGALVGTTAAMEYSRDGGNSWTDCAENETTGLAAGEYQVRVKATDTTLASDPQTVTIGIYAAELIKSGDATPSYYDDLGSAFGEAKSSGVDCTVKLLRDYECTEDVSFVIQDWKSKLVVDLNGKKLSTSGDLIFYVKNTDALAVINTANQQATITAARAFHIEAKGIVTIGKEDGTCSDILFDMSKSNSINKSILATSSNNSNSCLVIYGGEYRAKDGCSLIISKAKDGGVASAKLCGGTFDGISVETGSLAGTLANRYAFKSSSGWVNDLSGKSLGDVSVAKAPIQSTTFTPGKTDITYGESVTLEASATTLNSAAATYQWYDNDQLLAGETNSTFTSSTLSAGEHVIRCEISCDDYTVKREAKITVNAKALNESMVAGLVNSTPYTGSDVTFTIAVTDNGTALVEDTDYTVTYENNHNVGSAKVTIEGIGNYSGTVTKTFDITKATLSVSGTPSASDTYGTPLKDIEVTGLTVTNTATDETVDGTWKFQGDELLPAGNAEERTATFYPSDGNGNYAFLVSMQVTPTVAKAQGSVTAPKAIDGLVYNGTKQALVTAASSDTGTVLYSLDGQSYDEKIPAGTKAGAYTVYYKVEGDGNHKDVAAQSISVKIAKAPVTITVKSKTIYVGEKAPSLDNPVLGVDYEVEGLVGTDTLITAPTLAYVDNNGKPIAPDTSKANGNAARIQASNADAGGNYDIGSCSDGTLIVKSSPYTPPTPSPSPDPKPDPKPDPTPEPTPAAPSVGDMVSPGEAGASATFTVTTAADESGNGGELQLTSPAPNAGSSVVIPETVTVNGVTYTVTSIADGAFAGMGQLESVSIPQTVTSIGADAFKGCKRLSSIEIPGSVASIGAGAFQGSGLTSIALPASVKSIASDTFKDCKSLKQASSSATAIGKNAFYGCTALKSATLPKATSIGAGAFKGCKALKSVALSSGLKSIGKGAFAGCKSLTSITVTSKKLTKKGVTGSLEGSSVAKVTVQVGSFKQNKSYAKKYAKYFTKKICGKKGVKVTASKKPLKK